MQWQKKSSRWEGEGDKGGKGGKKGKKLKEKKGRNGKEKKKKKTMERGRIEPPSRIDLAMPYPSPTVTLKLQFWTYCDSDL